MDATSRLARETSAGRRASATRISPRASLLVALLVAFVALGSQPAWSQGQKARRVLRWPRQYLVTDLGALGHDTNQPWAVNAAGQVAGYSRLSDSHGGFHHEGFFFDGVQIDYLGTPGGAGSNDLLGINDLGEAVGKTWGSDGQAIMRRSHGGVQQLGTLGGSRSFAKAINNWSQVVGSSKLVGDFESRAFLWENGKMTALPVLGGTQATAEWVNDAGQIVGSSTTDSDGLMQVGVVWEGGSVTRLPPVHAGQNNLALYIHDDGSIAGRVSVPGPTGFLRRAAVWRDGQLDLMLGTLADGTPQEPYASSSASAVNANGVVVGMSVNAEGAYVPFVYRNGTLFQLDELMPDPWTAVFVGQGCLNDLGQVVVSAVGPDGSHALLLTP